MKLASVILKWTLIAIGAVLLLAIAGAGVCLYKYRTLEKENMPAEIVTAVHYDLQDNTATMGTAFHAELTIKLPWNKSFGTVSVSEKRGVQKLSAPQISRAKTGFGYCLWNVSLPLQTYDVFDSLEEPATMSIPCSAKDNAETLNVILPTLKSAYTPKNPDSDPVPASAITKKTESTNHRTIVLCCAAGLLLIAVIIGILLRHRNKQGKPSKKSILQTTLEQLQNLRENVQCGKTSATNAVNQLTLVLRAYVELRFHLPAERQTTAEFIDRLRNERNMFNSDQQYFLEDFLCATDKIKYANMPADRQMFLAAADSIEKFVRARESVPQENQ